MCEQRTNPEELASPEVSTTMILTVLGDRTGASDPGTESSSLHIPTERVAFALLVRRLITEFQVVPNRRDWERALELLLHP